MPNLVTTFESHSVSSPPTVLAITMEQEMVAEPMKKAALGGEGGGKTLKFDGIKYSVKLDKAQMSKEEWEAAGKKPVQKPILHGVSGVVEGGQMMCCLGPSGSGKTSLIHIVAGHIRTTANGSHLVEGQRTVDGVSMTS